MDKKRFFYFFIILFTMGCGGYLRPQVVLEKPVSETGINTEWPEVLIKQTRTDQNRYFYYLSAQRRIADGNLDRAVLELQKVIDLDPENAYLRRELAMGYLQQQNSDAAMEVIESLIGQYPDDSETLFLYARTLESLDRREEAKDAYEKLIAGDPLQETVFLRLGDLYLEENDLDNAFLIYSKQVERFPYSYAGHFFLGKIYSVRGEFGKAEVHIQRTMELLPGLEEPQYELADIYKKKGDPQKAVGIYRGILEQNPDSVFAALELAVLYQKNGSADLAAELLKKVGAGSYNDPALYRIIGQEYLEQNRYQEAVMLLEGMLKSAPETSGISYLLGIALAGDGQTESAVETFKQVDESSRFFMRAAIQTALLYQELGLTDTAIEYVKHVLESHQDNQELYLFLAMFYEEKELYENASQALKDGLRLNEQHVQMNFRLGIVYDKLGDKKHSIEQMKTVIRLDPKHLNALNYLGYTYADMGIKLDEAEKLIKTALENKPGDGYITDSLGWVYFKRGKFDQAATILEEAARLVPDDPIIREHLGDVYLELNQTQKALDAYRRSLLLKHEDESLIEEKIRFLQEKGL